MKILFIFILAIFAFAEEYCDICGMNLKNHEQTSHTITSEDNTIKACSLHCVYDAVSKDSTKKYTIRGFDNVSRELKGPKDLFYVVGSNKKGTMTSESEFAFSSKEKANNFIKENGGRIVEGKDILKYTETKFSKDKQMIEKNQSKMIAMGEKIANEYCDTNELKKIKTRAKSMAQFKIEAKGYCKNIDQNALQAVGLYFWQK